jgi:hypothetical protein
MAQEPKETDQEREDREAAEEEMAFERRAAFGPGETVVNVLTGETFKT